MSGAGLSLKILWAAKVRALMKANPIRLVTLKLAAVNRSS